jgi:hypothetical protein
LSRRANLITILVVLAFAAYLLWSTLSSQRVECRVTVAFRDRENVGIASAASEADAAREAQTAACGPLAQGMDESIACSRVPPVDKACRAF